MRRRPDEQWCIEGIRVPSLRRWTKQHTGFITLACALATVAE